MCYPPDPLCWIYMKCVEFEHESIKWRHFFKLLYFCYNYRVDNKNQTSDNTYLFCNHYGFVLEDGSSSTPFVFIRLWRNILLMRPAAVRASSTDAARRQFIPFWDGVFTVCFYIARSLCCLQLPLCMKHYRPMTVFGSE